MCYHFFFCHVSLFYLIIEWCEFIDLICKKTDWKIRRIRRSRNISHNTKVWEFFDSNFDMCDLLCLCHLNVFACCNHNKKLCVFYRIIVYYVCCKSLLILRCNLNNPSDSHSTAKFLKFITASISELEMMTSLPNRTFWDRWFHILNLKHIHISHSNNCFFFFMFKLWNSRSQKFSFSKLVILRFR